MEKGIVTRRTLKASKEKMDGELLSLHWMDHNNIFSQAIKGLRRKDAFTDATLACEGHFYPVHKFVLSTCSEYFSDIFEWTPCVNPVIVINNIICSELEVLLDFMYNGEVNVKENVISGVLHAANCLKIRGLTVVDEEGQKAQITTKSSAATSPLSPKSAPTTSFTTTTSFSGPPKKKSRHDVKRKAPPSPSSRSSTPLSSPSVPSFRVPPPPRPSSKVQTASRPLTPHPSIPNRPSVPSHSNHLPSVSSFRSPPSPTPTLPASTVSVPPSLTPPPPTPPPPTPPPLVSKVPSHTTTTVVSSTSTPLYTSGCIVTPILNLSIPSTVCHTSQSQPETQPPLQTVSVGLHNQVSYPQIITTPSQNQLVQQQTFSGQSVNHFIVSPQAQTQLVQSHTSTEGPTILIDRQGQQEQQQQIIDVQHPVSTHSSQLSTHLNCVQYDLQSSKSQDLEIEPHQQGKEVLISIQPEDAEVQDPSQQSPGSSERFDPQSPHSVIEKAEVKMEVEDRPEPPVVMSVSVPGHSGPPEISIPQMNPIDTLIEAVKMEEQDIVIRTEKGPVGIPEFLDSLEMSEETPQNSERNASVYEFEEVYPQTSSSLPEVLQTTEEQPRPQPQSSTSSDNANMNRFTCTLCKKTFKNKEYLKRHGKIHTGKRPLRCSLCNFTTDVFKDLTAHKETHAETKACQNCDFTTKSMKEFTLHKKIHVEPFSCPLCDFTSKNVKEFSQHRKTHPEPYQCPHCEFNTARLDSIRRHIQRHKENSQHQCQYCSFSCSSKPMLAKHIKSLHGKLLMKDG